MSNISIGDKIQEVLKQAGKPLSFEELLASCQVGAVDDTWTAAFDTEVMENRVLFCFEPGEHNYSGLRFYSGESVPQAMGEDPVVAAIIAQLARNTDNRGDDWPILAPDEIFPKQVQFFSVDSVATALQVGFKEKLFRFMSRSRNKYITISLSDIQYYTVMAVDPHTFEPYCLYVRAGTEEVALTKAYVVTRGVRSLKTLSITEGRTAVRAIPTSWPVIFEEVGTIYMPKY